jgi:hypothetical protein
VVKVTICISALFLFFCSCDNNSSNSEDELTSQIVETTHHILIFKKEQKLEVWKIGTKNTFVEAFQLKNLQQLPIGQFDLKFDKKDKKLLINFPSNFYKTKSYPIHSNQNFDLGIDNLSEQFFKKMQNIQLSQIIIFPNDNRTAGDLIPCFACPHWMAELYAFLNLKKKEYI